MIGLVYLLLASVYMVIIPLGEAPDEPSHLLCIADAFDNQRVPRVDYPKTNRSVRNREYVLSRYECLHPPLYALLGAGIWQLADWLFADVPEVAFPPTNPDFATTSGTMFVPSRSGLLKPTADEWGILLLRAAGILTGLGTLALTVSIGRCLFPHQAAAVAAAGLVAAWPQFLFQSRNISNDTLTTFLAAATLFCLLRPRRNTILLSSFLFLALMTKLTNLFLLPLVALVLLFDFKTVAGPRWLKLYLLPVLLSVLALVLLYALVPVLWENVAHSSVYFGAIREKALQWDYWRQLLRMLSSTFWAAFGWASVRATTGLTTCLSLWFLAGLVSYLVWLGRRWKALPGSVRQAHLIALAAALLVVAQFGRMNLGEYQPQGRLLFPVLPIVAAWGTFGWLRWAPRRWRVVLTVAMLWILAGVNLYLLATRIVPAYRI